MQNGKIKNWLAGTNSIAFSVYAILAAFSAYACMYAFRKPFTAARFEGLEYWGIGFKTIIVIAQVFGYMLSKFLGIKIVSEMTAAKRAITIIVFILIAEISLFFFSIVPAPYNIIFMFINGLPLGMIWGLIFSYLEGRKLTEILGVGLCASFIVSSGFVKSVGSIVITNWGFSEFQMPYITGALFLLPLLFFVWALNQLPAPNEEDVKLKTKRIPMNKKDRKDFFMKFAFGIITLTVIYMFLSAFRDLRDNFAVEIWRSVGYKNMPMIFTYSELPIAFGTLLILSFMIIIKDNHKALLMNHYIVFGGLLLTGVSTFAFQFKIISPLVWMILEGFGLYMAYVPFNAILFDRMIAAFQSEGNSGFLIYIADAFGYFASVGVLLYKNFGQPNISWLGFFINSSYVMAVIGSALTVVSIIYFKNRKQTENKTILVQQEKLKMENSYNV
jgi:hypothetical protein